MPVWCQSQQDNKIFMAKTDREVYLLYLYFKNLQHAVFLAEIFPGAPMSVGVSKGKNACKYCFLQIVRTSNKKSKEYASTRWWSRAGLNPATCEPRLHKKPVYVWEQSPDLSTSSLSTAATALGLDLWACTARPSLPRVGHSHATTMPPVRTMLTLTRATVGQEDIAECRSSPCLSGGDCLERSWPGLYGLVPGLPPAFRYDRAEGYICRCPPGFAGKGRVGGCLLAGSGEGVRLGPGPSSARSGRAGLSSQSARPAHLCRQQNNLPLCAQLWPHNRKSRIYSEP
ncbi:hypothetical protein Nmel_011039 [Mimus melanotis]